MATLCLWASGILEGIVENELTESVLSHPRSLQVVILAAGQGTRMRSGLPKVLHPIAGQGLNLGLRDVEIGPHVWDRVHVIPFVNGLFDGQRERIFLVRTPAFDPRPRLSWEELRADCPAATPFQSWAWLYSWWRNYGAPDRRLGLRLVAAREGPGGPLVGLAPSAMEALMSTSIKDEVAEAVRRALAQIDTL